MKMLYKYMSEPIDFENSPIVLLVIENKQLFRKTILSNYHNNVSELFVFSEDYKPIDFSKKIKFIDDILTFEFADKKLMAKVNASFEAMCNIKFFNEISQLKESCYSMCESLAEEYDFDFDFCNNLETASLIKLFAFVPRDDTESIMERLVRYFKLLNRYLGIKCFMLQNMHLYLTDTEIVQFLSSVKIHNICIVDIENHIPENISGLENLVIIDKDLCEIIDKNQLI